MEPFDEIIQNPASRVEEGARAMPYALVLIISLIVYAVFFYRARLHKPPPAPTAKPPRILQRLDIHKRGALISLSVQDHYVDVVTTKGTGLLLLRLSDAIAETEPTAGLQVHRSHWVAADQIARAQRSGDKAILTMTDGRDIPVSRTYLKTVREAGIL